MKKFLMALTVVGLFHFSAEAQSQRSSKNAKNYPVCRYGDTYAVCGDVPTGYITAPAPMPVYRQTNDDVYVDVSDNGVKPVSQEEFRKRHNIVVYDELRSAMPPYTEPEAKREYRNMNVNQTSIQLPPNTGTIK